MVAEYPQRFSDHLLRLRTQRAHQPPDIETDDTTHALLQTHADASASPVARRSVQDRALRGAIDHNGLQRIVLGPHGVVDASRPEDGVAGGAGARLTCG